MVGCGHAVLEVAPGVTRHVEQVVAVRLRHTRLRGPSARAAGPPREQRCRRPQQAQQRRPCGRRRAAHQQHGEQGSGGHGLAPMLAQDVAEVLPGHRLRGFGGRPLQQVALAHGHAVGRTRHGIGSQPSMRQQLRHVPQRAAGGARQLGQALAVEVAQGDVVPARRQARHSAKQRPGTEGGHHEQQGVDGCGAPARQADCEQPKRGRRDERAAQVVEHLPAVDGADAVVARARQQRQQLPVSAGPAVQARRRHVGMHGRFFEEHDVADAAAARDGAFEQVVAQHRPLGQARAEHDVQRLHVQQALAGERAFAEQVLVDLGRGGAVRVDPALAGEQPMERRGFARPGQRRGHARLQDAVARRDAALRQVDARQVQRVCRHADQFTQAAGGQLGVAVERDDVGRARRRLRREAQVDEWRRGGRRRIGREPVDQLLQLAALALPADPALLGLAEAAAPVQQQKARGCARCGRVACVQRLHCGHGRRKQRRVGVGVLGIGIGRVGEQRELRVRFQVSQVMTLELARERLDALHAAHQGRHDDQHPVFGRDAVAQRQARQAPRAGGLADEPVDERDHGL